MDQYGIGPAINGAIQLYFSLARGTGRTTSLIESLKSGDVVVFCDRKEAARVVRMCRELGVDIKPVVVTPEQPERIFEVLPRDHSRVVFDHTFIERYYTHVIDCAMRRIDGIQREASGPGVAHAETRMMAKRVRCQYIEKEEE